MNGALQRRAKGDGRRKTSCNTVDKRQKFFVIRSAYLLSCNNTCPITKLDTVLFGTRSDFYAFGVEQKILNYWKSYGSESIEFHLSMKSVECKQLSMKLFARIEFIFCQNSDKNSNKMLEMKSVISFQWKPTEKFTKIDKMRIIRHCQFNRQKAEEHATDTSIDWVLFWSAFIATTQRKTVTCEIISISVSASTLLFFLAMSRMKRHLMSADRTNEIWEKFIAFSLWLNMSPNHVF